jgi:aryl-alcohol dehydrogenase-like predicted oxidoreductase
VTALITGFATQEGTKSYAEQNSSLVYGELNGTRLLASQAGFGCYRVDLTDPEHEKSLRKALLSGINLIDISSNYGDGGAEKLVGEVLENLVSSGEISRESVIVVSKAGYLQGQNYRLSQERKGQGKAFKDLVLYADGLEHCIHPEFIDDQLTRSLERLKLDTLDFYLLHNPEYYLSWASKTGVPKEHARQEYYTRIEQAFEHLEAEVERGRISFYGISSNTFPSPASDPEFTSLEKVWEIARSLSSDHHFRLIQLPMNLLETGGITEKNQGKKQSVLEFACEKNLGVLINRPLNAIVHNRLLRLSEVKSTRQTSDKEVTDLIDKLIISEAMLENRILPQLGLPPATQSQVVEQLATGAVLKQHWQSFGTYERWQELQEYYFFPRVKGVFQLLKQQADLAEEISSWVNSHWEKLEVLLEAVGSSYRQEAAKRCGQIKNQLASMETEWSEAPTLSQMAIRALRSTAGITTVLVGMRREAYVEDVLEELARPVENKERRESWNELRKLVDLNTL